MLPLKGGRKLKGKCRLFLRGELRKSRNLKPVKAGEQKGKSRGVSNCRCLCPGLGIREGGVGSSS